MFKRTGRLLACLRVPLPTCCRTGPSKTMTTLSSMFLIPLIPKSKSVGLWSEVAREVFSGRSSKPLRGRHSRSMRCARYLMAPTNRGICLLGISCASRGDETGWPRGNDARAKERARQAPCDTHGESRVVHKRTDMCVRACVRKQGWQGGPKRSFSIRSPDVHSGVFVGDIDRGQINVCRALTYVHCLQQTSSQSLPCFYCCMKQGSGLIGKGNAD